MSAKSTNLKVGGQLWRDGESKGVGGERCGSRGAGAGGGAGEAPEKRRARGVLRRKGVGAFVLLTRACDSALRWSLSWVGAISRFGRCDN